MIIYGVSGILIIKRSMTIIVAKIRTPDMRTGFNLLFISSSFMDSRLYITSVRNTHVNLSISFYFLKYSMN